MMLRRSMGSVRNTVIRLGPVEGCPGCSNHILYHPPMNQTLNQPTVIFFGGDIQDYPEVMRERGEGNRWSSWNLEATAKTISAAFPSAHILVIRPSRMEEGTYSCYDNFVDCAGERGVPKHKKDGQAFRHLRCLLNSTERAVNEHPESGHKRWKWRGGSGLIIIGFSKGCVVLNQLVYEMALPNPVEATLEPDSLESLVDRERVSHFSEREKLLGVRVRTMPEPMSRRIDPGLPMLFPPINSETQLGITDMYWLDGGHSGDAETWVTDPEPLSALASSGISCHVHVTPFQMSKVITRRDEALFTGTLTELGGRVSRRLHYQLDPPSLTTHFRLLRDFSNPLPTPPL